MVVRAGREFLAIPGPTTMPDEVLRAMHRPALDIYSEEMVQLSDGLLRDLSGSYALPFYGCIGLELIAAMLIMVRKASS